MLLRAIIAAAIIATAGCSTIMNDRITPVSVTSDPAGAEYRITNQAGRLVKTGVTPDNIKLDAAAGYFDGERYEVAYAKDGREPKKEVLDSQVTGWYFGGVLLTLIGGLIVDPATGDMYTLPGNVHAELPPSPLAITGQ